MTRRVSSLPSPKAAHESTDRWPRWIALADDLVPSPAIAPVTLLTRRAILGEYWTETVNETNIAVPRLTLTDRSDVQRPRDGAGPLNHRIYRVYIRDSIVGADQLLESFRRDPNRSSPTSFATFVPDPRPEGLSEGDTYEVKLPGPWDGPIHVRTVEPDRVRLETLCGHMEAGWIEFRASATDNVIDFTIESYARSGDPVSMPSITRSELESTFKAKCGYRCWKP